MKPINTRSPASTSIHKLEKKYFELRISQESELLEFKIKQNREKAKLSKELKKLKGVSRLRIHNAMTLYKRFTVKNPTERTDDVFNFIINDLERSFKRHYEQNEAQIKNYVSSLFTMNDELVQFRNEKKKKYNSFKKQVQKYNIDLSILDHAYNEFKLNIKYIKSEGISLEEYNVRVSRYAYLNDITDMFIQEEYSKHINKKEEIQKEKDIKKENERIYLETIQNMFSIDKKKNDSYHEIYNIVNSIFMQGELA